jgi:hypothetical protein
MATLYYNNAEADGDIGNLLNWWTDAGFTTPGTVPTSGDTANIAATASANSGGACAPTDLNVTAGTLSAIVAVENAVACGGAGVLGAGVITATTVSINAGGAANNTTITAAVTVNSDDPTCISNLHLTGDLTWTGDYVDAFPDFSSTVSGSHAVTGTVAFNSAANAVSPSYSIASVVFNDSNNSGSIITDSFGMTGAAANNSGTVVATNAPFASGATNIGGIVTGNASFNGAYSAVTFSGTVSGTISLGAAFALTTSSAWTINTTAWTVDAAASFTFTAAAGNTGILPRAIIAGTGTNLGGTVTGLLAVPGTQAGTKIVSNLAFADLGTFGTLAVSGIAASNRGGGGPLGGPGIEF